MIIGGNANYMYDPDNSGGGMYNSGGSPTLNACVFHWNSGNGQNWMDPNTPPLGGGGIYNGYNSNPIVSNCTFRENSAVNIHNGLGAGGGIRNADSNPTLINCAFINNIAVVGDNIYNESSSLTLIDWTFGEGIYCDYSTTVTIADSLFNFADIEFNTNWGFEYVVNFMGTDPIDLAATGTIMIASTVIVGQEVEVFGGDIVVPLEEELIFEDDSILNLGAAGELACDGLFRARGRATIENTTINVSRASFEDNTIILNSVINAEVGVPFGQFFIEESATVIGNDIHADGDRYMDLDPSVFFGLMQDNRIYVTITEGVGQERGGLLELRGQPDLVSSSCDPNEFFCQVESDSKCGGADLNNSGEVNLPDLHLLMSHWLEEDTDPDWLEKADLDNTNSINLGDFAIMGRHWLETDCTNP